MWKALHRRRAAAVTMTTMRTAVQSVSAQASRPRQFGTVAAVVATVIGLTTMVVSARSSAGASWAPTHVLAVWTPWPAVIAAAAIVGATWALRVDHPYAGVALATTAAGVLLPLWSTWRSVPDVIATGLLAAAPLAIGGTASVSLGWSSDRPRGPLAASRVAWGLVGAAVLVHLLGYNPFADPGCAWHCAEVRPPLDPLLSTRAVVGVTTAAVAAASGLFARTAWRRRQLAPRLVVGAVLVVLVAQAVMSAARWFAWGDTTARSVLLAIAPLSATVVAVAAAIVVGRTSRTRGAVERMVARLSEARPMSGDRRAGVSAVHYAGPSVGRWIDADGHDMPDLAHGRRAVVVSDDTGPVLRFVLDRTADEGDLLVSLTPASVLALRNAQLSAVAKARLADVRAAQRRIVAASDGERRRIERDLHDGAQQRLVSVALHLKVAVARADPRGAAALDRAHDHVRDALARLRSLAHGPVPSALADEGLDAALRELVATSDVPATLHVHLAAPVATGPALAAFHVAASALGSMPTEPGGTVQLSVVGGDGAVTVNVTVEGRHDAAMRSACADVSDRVDAADGTLSTTTSADGTVTVTAVIPCGS